MLLQHAETLIAETNIVTVIKKEHSVFRNMKNKKTVNIFIFKEEIA